MKQKQQWERKQCRKEQSRRRGKRIQTEQKIKGRNLRKRSKKREKEEETEEATKRRKKN